MDIISFTTLPQPRHQCRAASTLQTLYLPPLPAVCRAQPPPHPRLTTLETVALIPLVRLPPS